MNNVTELCKNARLGAYKLNALTAEDRNNIITAIADEIDANHTEILSANAVDIHSLSDINSVFRDRLTLNPNRINTMRDGLRQISTLSDPIGEITDSWVTKAGLNISKVRAPLGVVGVIYEARPNVTIDVVGLCIKTANAVVLRGGSDAINTNRALYNIIIRAISRLNFPTDMVQFIDNKDRSATLQLLEQGKYVDVIIPRGGDKLKELVLKNATMPVIASAGGNCHVYVHKSADIDMAAKIILNAKTQRPTVCNSLEQVVIDRDILKTAITAIFPELRKAGVVIKADEEICALDSDCELATDSDYYTEHLSLTLSVKTVSDVYQAVEWINDHSTMHSDAIVASDQTVINYFTSQVDSGCIYVNASTRFTDGFEYGFGAEIGISTQKLHARGPLGIRQLTSEKYIAVGNGTIRD